MPFDLIVFSLDDRGHAVSGRTYVGTRAWLVCIELKLRYSDYHSKSPHYMFVPITSEVTIGTGMVLKEIATGRLFEVGERLKQGEEVWGDDPWEITEIAPGTNERTALALKYEMLAMKYLAEVED